MKYKRREFLKTGGAVLVCSCLGGLCFNRCSPFSSVSNTTLVPSGDYRIEQGQIVLDLKKAIDLSSIGGAVKLEFYHPGDGMLTKIILIHPADSSYVAFANSCTHNGKELDYDHSTRKLLCVSRHSKFDINGKVLEGNAEKSLKSYATDRDWDTLIVKI